VATPNGFVLAIRSQRTYHSTQSTAHEDKDMKIKLTSVFVDDQEKALGIYTRVLGFVKKMDITAGKFR
jgi:hypothetical protein